MSQHKKRLLPLIGVLACAVLVSLSACKKAEDKTTAEAETTTMTAEGTETTVQTETERVGENVAVTTETTTEGKGPNMEAMTSVWTGTVTEYKQFDSLQIMTVDNDKKSFDLDAKDWMAKVDPGIQVGSRVRIVEDKTEGRKMLTVTLEK